MIIKVPFSSFFGFFRLRIFFQHWRVNQVSFPFLASASALNALFLAIMEKGRGKIKNKKRRKYPSASGAIRSGLSYLLGHDRGKERKRRRHSIEHPHPSPPQVICPIVS
jgi:hypothetical protein